MSSSLPGIVMVLRVPAHFDGEKVVLDAPVPADWQSGMPLEVQSVVASAATPLTREEAVRQLLESTAEFVKQAEGQPRGPGRTWKREDAYE